MFRLYKKYLKKNLHLVIIGPIFKLFEAVFELLVPFVIKNMIDNGINNTSISASMRKEYITQQGILLFVFAAVGLCSTLVCQFIASRVSQRFGTDVRNDYFKHINTLSFKELDELNASSIINRQTNDIYNVEKSVAMLIRLVIRSPFLVIGATVLAFVINYVMGIIFLVTAILLFVIFGLIMRFGVPANKKVQAKLDDVSNDTLENLNGVRVVRAFRKEETEKRRFINDSVLLSKYSLFAGKLNSLLNPLTFVVVNVATILIMNYGKITVSTSELSQGDIQALINYMTQILIAIIAVTGLVTVFTKAYSSSIRINQVFDMKSSITDGSFDEGKDELELMEFKDVSFSYNESSNKTLNNISFKILSGQTIGIIGGTGCGKTSIVNLMNRFYDASSGEVLYKGRNIKDYKLDFIRNDITTVLQKSVLFNDTLINNLKWGNNDASDEEIASALSISQAQFAYDLEDGLNTKIMENGRNLSGGQRQRLCIARALIKGGDLLILDDSSSALDYQTDYQLRMALKNVSKTIVIISQRASAILHADQIIVLDNGRIVGIGTHKELLMNNTIYKEICQSQEIYEEVA